MKNTGKIFGAIVLAAVILFSVSACGKSSPPSGTYGYSEIPQWTITFNSGSFTMFVPASISPSGENIVTNGTFTVSGKTMILTGLDEPLQFTITNSRTLKESDGSVWKKQ